MKFRIRLGLDRFSGLYLWAAFIIMFTIWTPLFFTTATLHSIASGQAVAGILTVGLLIPLVTGVFDLSVGATANVTAITVIQLQTVQHLGIALSIILSFVLGALIGVVNGFLVVVLKINSFIATLAMGSVLAALLTIFTDNEEPSPPTSAAWSDLTQRSLGGFQIVFIYFLVIAVLVWWALEYTPAGRYMRVIGSNAEAARLSGVAVGRWIWISLVCSAAISGLAGIAFSSSLGPSLTFGQSLLLPAFAAAFLGSTQLMPGRFNVWGSVIAIYVLATGVQGFQFVTGVQWLSDMFNGIALIVAVAFAVWRQSAAGNGNRSRDWRRVLRRRAANVGDMPEFADAAPVSDALHPAGHTDETQKT
jgi:ribose transport system permease protein